MLSDWKQVCLFGATSALLIWNVWKKKSKGEGDSSLQYIEREVKKLKKIIKDPTQPCREELLILRQTISDASKKTIAIFMKNEQKRRISEFPKLDQITEESNRHQFQKYLNSVWQTLNQSDKLPLKIMKTFQSLLQIPQQVRESVDYKRIMFKNNEGNLQNKVIIQDSGFTSAETGMKIFFNYLSAFLQEKNKKIIQSVIFSTKNWSIQSKNQIRAIIWIYLNDVLKKKFSSYDFSEFENLLQKFECKRKTLSTQSITENEDYDTNYKILLADISVHEIIFDQVIGEIESAFQKDFDDFIELMTKGFSQNLKKDKNLKKIEQFFENIKETKKLTQMQEEQPERMQQK